MRPYRGHPTPTLLGASVVRWPHAVNHSDSLLPPSFLNESCVSNSVRSHIVATLRIPGISHVLAVASGKGGVGKTTVAVNLALALRQNGIRVGVFDADLYGPNILLMFGVPHRPSTGKPLNIL